MRTLGHAVHMAEVDAGDDSLGRYVVYRYAFDPERNERRHQVVVAFDSERESMRFFEAQADDLRRRRDAGELVDPREHYSGGFLEPGHQNRAQNARLIQRAAEHGVRPRAQGDVDLPASVTFLRSD